MKLKQRIYRLFVNLKQRTSRLLCLIIVCFAALFGLSSSVNAARWYVDGTVVDCDNDGDSWTNAFKYLQDALAAAAVGDEIWVAAGAGPYYPDQDCLNPGGTGNQALSFDMIGAVEVYGGFAGDEVNLEDRDIVANETILSGNIGDAGDDTDNSNNVVRFDSLTGAPAVLDGFGVRAGYADNDEISGGGVFVGQTASSIIRNCTFQDNFGLDHGGGLGVFNNDAGDVIEVRNCRFESNLSLEGGGIGYKFTEGDINIINCDFSANGGFSFGGGLYGAGATLTIVNATFTENTANNGAGAYLRFGADALFINCLFASNTADQDAGAVCVNGPTTTTELVNCTLSDNHANDESGGIVGTSSSSTTITNCILWGNTDGDAGTDTEEAQIFISGASVTVTYTCIEGLDIYTGNNNIGDDPLFFDPFNGNYRLAADSPCIDKGNNADVPCDEFDIDEDGFDCLSDPVQDTPDLDLAVRIVDGDEFLGAVVDMGPYESVPCPWDLDNNCVVGASDLLILLANWFNPYGAADLLDLLAAWGPCPCDPFAVVLSLADELADACLSQADWDEYEDVMTDPNAPQVKKDRYHCWMEHYLFDCNKCICIGQSGCPNPDPFSS